VEKAVAKLGQVEKALTLLAFIELELCPHFPENLFPRYPVSFPHISNKLLQIPVLIDNMFLLDLTVLIDIGLLRVFTP
jgi:hypothetical protein